MQIIFKSLDELIPYKNNPRKNDKSVDLVVESIKNFGFKNPIIIDKNNVIVAGHTRHKASLKLGLNSVPCLIADDLSEEKIRAFRIADNRVGELSEWDNELLKSELENIEIFTGFDIENNFDEIEDINSYSQKIQIPNYEIKDEKPNLDELVNKEKYEKFIEDINKMNIEEDLKVFLRLASTRFLIFNYHKIAEFYSHSDKNTQQAFENLVLVIIDFNKAIEKGFIDFTERFFNEVVDDE